MGNIRHEVFGALLLAATLSSACTLLRPFSDPSAVTGSTFSDRGWRW